MKWCMWKLLPYACLCSHIWAGSNQSVPQDASSLLVACRDGHSRDVQAQLDACPRLANHAFATGSPGQKFTALSVASAYGRGDVVRRLLAAGADTDGNYCAVITPLMLACACGSGELYSYLLSALRGSLSPDYIESMSENEPQEEGSYRHCLRLLIDAGADINATDGKGRGALYFAAEQGNCAVLSLLTERGARVDGWSSYRNDPLCIATEEGHRACVRILLAARAPLIKDRSHQYSALHLAAQRGHADILELLLQHDNSVDTVNTPLLATPLLVAAMCGRVSCMRVLLGAGADVDLPDKNGCTPLYCAAFFGQSQAVALLAKKGAKVNGWHSWQTDPLCAAVSEGRVGCVRELLVAGATVVTGKGIGPWVLHLAVLKGYVEIVALLVAQRDCVDAENTVTSKSPLMIASEKGDEFCVSILLDAGANINRSDSSGRTALHHAVARGHLAVVAVLLGRGASRHHRDARGETPLMTAREHGYENLVPLLLDGEPRLGGSGAGAAA